MIDRLRSPLAKGEEEEGDGLLSSQRKKKESLGPVLQAPMEKKKQREGKREKGKTFANPLGDTKEGGVRNLLPPFVGGGGRGEWKEKKDFKKPY